MTTADLPDPPEAPQIKRGVEISWRQMLGLLLLAVLPLLALVGMFGEAWRTAHGAAGPLEVSVHYPSAFRYKMLNALDVQLTNRGAVTLDTVSIALDTSYVHGFSTITAVPPFTGSFTLDVTDLRPGHSTLVRIEIQAERSWRHSGHLIASTASDTVRVPISTVVFP